MTEIIPTLRIKSGDDYAVINECDYDASVHVLFDAVQTVSSPVVRRGPRGMFYVHKDGERIGNGYATEAEALASVSA